MLTALVLASAIQSTPLDCAAFQARIADPAPIDFQAISGEQLGGVRIDETLGRFQVGELIYRGEGAQLRSADPRFADLVIKPGQGMVHQCGNAVMGPSGWDARSRPTTHVMTFQPLRNSGGVGPGATAAAEAGVRPVLAGYRAGPSWPKYAGGGQFFLALMYPDDGSRRSVIVAFANRPGDAPARILARLPERFEDISVMPGLHVPPDFVYLYGTTADHALTHVVLELPQALEQSLAAEL